MKNEVDFRHQLITLIRIFKYGQRNLLRNAWLSVAAIAVMFVALVIILSTVVLNVTANNAIKELSKDLKAAIYLKDGVTDEQSKNLEQDLKSQDFVKGVSYVSKQQAQDRFTNSFKNDPSLLQGLSLIGSDTLPASYEVSVTDLGKLKDVEVLAKQEKHKTIVDSVSLGRTDARRTIDRAVSVQHFITKSSIVAASIFTVISVLIIFNTIRIAIYTRNEEIRSMKLIGATPGFIRGPFLVETAYYGIIAGVIAVAAVFFIVFSVGPKLASQAEFAQTYEFFSSPLTVLLTILGTLLAGILVGMFSGALAMEKYLRLKRW